MAEVLEKLRRRLRICRALQRRRQLRAMADKIHERNRQAVAQRALETGGPVYARSDRSGKLSFYPDAESCRAAELAGD